MKRIQTLLLITTLALILDLSSASFFDPLADPLVAIQKQS